MDASIDTLDTYTDSELAVLEDEIIELMVAIRREKTSRQEQRLRDMEKELRRLRLGQQHDNTPQTSEESDEMEKYTGLDDAEDKPIFVDDAVKVNTGGRKGSAFSKGDEAIVVGITEGGRVRLVSKDGKRHATRDCVNLIKLNNKQRKNPTRKDRS